MTPAFLAQCRMGCVLVCVHWDRPVNMLQCHTQVCDALLTIEQLALCDLSSVQVTPLGDRWCHFE